MLKKVLEKAPGVAEGVVGLDVLIRHSHPCLGEDGPGADLLPPHPGDGVGGVLGEEEAGGLRGVG